MNRDVPIFLHTEDPDLVRRVHGYAGLDREIRHVPDPVELRDLLRQNAPCLLLLDIRESRALDLVREIRRRWALTVIVAFGAPRSEPVLQARSMGLHAVMPPDFDGEMLSIVVEQAAGQVALAAEAQVLRDRLAADAGRPAATHSPPERAPIPPLRHFFPPLRHFHDTERLLHGIIDGIADAAVVLRAGLFVREEREDEYRLRAGIGCLESAGDIVFAEDSPLAQWLRVNAQVVSRSGLSHVADLRDRLALQRALDMLGAELIVPLQGRRRLSGWLFLGRRATGAPFSAADLQDVMVLRSMRQRPLKTQCSTRKWGCRRHSPKPCCTPFPPESWPPEPTDRSAGSTRPPNASWAYRARRPWAGPWRRSAAASPTSSTARCWAENSRRKSGTTFHRARVSPQASCDSPAAAPVSAPSPSSTI
jgi:hypothetical protein